MEILMSRQQSSLSLCLTSSSTNTLNTSNDDQNSCKKEMRSTKMVNIFLHTTLLVSLNCRMQLYTFSICFMTTVSQLFPPLTQQFHYVAPSFHCLPLTLQGQNKWLCWRADRLSVSSARGDLGTQRSAASSPSTASCFCKLSH